MFSISPIRATNLGHSAGISGDMGLVRMFMPTTVMAGRSMTSRVMGSSYEPRLHRRSYWSIGEPGFRQLLPGLIQALDADAHQLVLVGTAFFRHVAAEGQFHAGAGGFVVQAVIRPGVRFADLLGHV